MALIFLSKVIGAPVAGWYQNCITYMSFPVEGDVPVAKGAKSIDYSRDFLLIALIFPSKVIDVPFAPPAGPPKSDPQASRLTDKLVSLNFNSWALGLRRAFWA